MATPLGRALRAKYRNPKEAILALGLDESLLKADLVVGDSTEKLNMTKVKLSRTGAAAYGALVTNLRPKMAKDTKLGLASAFVGVTAQNFKERIPGIKLALDGALKGKLANDAEAGEIVKAAAKLLDMFQPEAMDDELDDPDMTAMDGKWGEDDEKELQSMMERKKAAADKSARDSETDEERKKREEAEKKTAEDDAAKGGVESPVTKAAMDSALAKMAADNALAVKNAEAATVKRMNDIADAKALVEPIVGKIAVAMDSADAVYDVALKSMKIATDGVNLAGKKALVVAELAHRSSAGKPALRLAHDADAKSARQTAESALGITTKRARHV